jgi:hypothetical protein
MARETTDEPAASAAKPRDDPPAERSGPLEIERLRKDDGRALLLYRLKR